jgi:hypothetical protein
VVRPPVTRHEGSDSFLSRSIQRCALAQAKRPAPGSAQVVPLGLPRKVRIVPGAVGGSKLILSYSRALYSREGELPVRELLILLNLHALLITFLVLPAITSLRLGEYPANSHSPPLATRLRRWFFFVIKIAFIIQILSCTSISSKSIQPYVWVVYLLAFRWALIDQRRRCPVCLRLLTNPTRIGGPSQTFLEWYGIELMCARGHGLLYVPEIPTSCYSTQRWLYLDASWSGLFS